MFDSINGILVSPDSMSYAPSTFTEKELKSLRQEAEYRALEYIRGTRPEQYGVHPLGFLNIPLEESIAHRLRLHIWNGTMFSATSPHKIHDHSYSTYSVILAGRLRNVTYGEVCHAKKEANCPEYSIALATPGLISTSLSLTNTRVRLKPLGESLLGAGSAYALSRGVFHYAHALTNFVATLYIHLRHPDSPSVSRVAVPVKAVEGGTYGRFQYNLLDNKSVLELKKAVSQELG